MHYLQKIFNITNAYCLLLDKRINFWDELYNSFKSIAKIELQKFLVGDGSLNESYSHIDINSTPYCYHDSINYGPWYRPQALNAWLSHRKIIEKSLEEGFNHVLIVEDDVFIEDDFDEVLWKAEPFFIDNKWDALYFGGYHNDDSWSLTSNHSIMKLKGSGGWHSILLKMPLMEELMNELPTGPYDWIMGQKYHQKYDCYAIYPSVVSQKDQQFSYVENQILNKPSRWKR